MAEDKAGSLEGSKDGLKVRILRALTREIPVFAALTSEQQRELTQPLDDYAELIIPLIKSGKAPGQSLRQFLGRYRGDPLYRGISFPGFVTAIYAITQTVWEDLVEGETDPERIKQLSEARDNVTSTTIKALSEAYLLARDEMVNRQLEQLTGLLNVGQAITSTTDLDRVLQEILEVSTNLVEAKMGAVLLLDEDTGLLRAVSQIGLSKTWLKGRTLDMENSLLAKAIQAGSPVTAQGDELEGLDLPQLAFGAKVRTAISVPITVAGRFIGGIELYDNQEKQYGPVKVALMRNFAPQAGVAIENARLYEAEKRRRRQAVTMKELAEDVSRVLNLGQALQLIAHRLAEAAGVSRCMIFFYEDVTDTLEFARGLGMSQRELRLFRNYRVGLDRADPAYRKVIQGGTPLLVTDADVEVEFHTENQRSLHLASVLILPLRVKKNTIGIAVLDEPGEAHGFSQDDTEVVAALAGQAASAIEQARLRERIHQKEIALHRAEARERLFRERERSEAIIDASPDAIFMVDREHYLNLFNPASADLTGWQMNEALGRSCHEILFHEPYIEGVCSNALCPIAACFRGERQAYTEFQLKRKDNSEVWVGGSFAPIRNRKRQIERVVCTIRDITEQKELQSLALVQKEVEIASKLQSTLLPEDSLEMKQLRIRARLKPARSIGGDWYDYWVDGDKLNIVMGDASGHGLPGALLGTMAMSIIRAEAQRSTDLLEVVQMANAALLSTHMEDIFITLFFAELDLKALNMRFVNCGHHPALIIRGGMHAEYLRSEHKFILGGMPDPDLAVEECSFETGDRLVLYTDGMVDCQDERGRPYGFGRLLRYANAQAAQAPDLFIDGLFERLNDFAGLELKDDVTVLVCDFK